MTQLASDDFNRSNGGLGANWTTLTGVNAPEINSNEARSNSGVNGLAAARYNAVSGPNDQYAEIVIGSVVCTVSDEGVGPCCRMASAAETCYFVQTNTSETRLWKLVAGSFTQLGSDGVACATGNTLRLTCNGTSISVSKNGSTIIGPVTDSGISTGSFGIWASNPGSSLGTIDSWAAGDLSGTATAIIFDRSRRVLNSLIAR